MSGHLYAQAGDVVLIIEKETPSSSVMLYTFTPDGHIWDNWLPDIESAKEQAARNVSGFPGGIGAWNEIPPEATDLMVFGSSVLRNSN